jgi:hypothetical protein
VTLDTSILLIGDGFTAVVLCLLLGKRIYRSFPIFTCYLIWSIICDLGGLVVLHRAPDHYNAFYVANNAGDSLFQFGVIVEVFWSVLRPVRASLPKWILLFIVGILIVTGALVWPLTAGFGVSDLSKIGRINVHVQETVSILRILFFLALAGFSQLLSIGWRDRELQIATGLGFYSLVHLAVWLQHRNGPQYHSLDQLASVSYMCSLVYWVFSFAQQEAARREFTPQMESFLLAVAGNARSGRSSLSDPKHRSSNNTDQDRE